MRDLVDEIERVLPLDHTQEIEHEEKHELVRETEICARQAARDRRRSERQRNVHHRNRRTRADRGVLEVTRDPNLVDEIESPVQILGKLLELPEPHADPVVAVHHPRPEIVIQGGENVGVHVQDRDVTAAARRLLQR